MPLKPASGSLPFKEVIYTVSRLNREAKLALSQSFHQIQVEGELSNLAQPSSGHIYFTLKDSGAQIRCAMFKSRHRRTAFKPKNGQQVIVRADVSLFEQRGDYQLIVDSIEESGSGLLRLQFEQLMQKLSNEGLFDEDKKKAIPRFPNTIGIISSPSGAAIHDILAVFRRRAPHIQLNIYPTPVQGLESEKAVQQAIRSADHRGKCDLLILARGGGSAEDLSLFNSELIGREIHRCKTPIITGIGHEIDFSIADFVADKRAATPSVAAESSCIDNKQLLEQITQYASLLTRQIFTLLNSHRQQLNWMTKGLLQQHPNQQLLEKSQRIDGLEIRSHKAIKNRLQVAGSLLKSRENLLKSHSPHHHITLLYGHTDHLKQRLISAANIQNQHRQHHLSEAVRTLEAVSPLSTLARGYAIVCDSKNHKLLRSADDAQVEENIDVRLSSGSLTCLVKEIHND
jgi:exodeoxyribonuclease VII large subunit